MGHLIHKKEAVLTLKKMVSSVNTDDGRIDFTQRKVLNLDNPLHLRGLSDDYTDVSVSALTILIT